MLLNRAEYVLMNHPLRALLQRRFEAKRLLQLGGRMSGGAALEMGCGNGVGSRLILDVFGADTVDAFDLDRRMVAKARSQCPCDTHARFWVGDATAVPAADATFDAVFDFGIIHHVPRWRESLCEVRRVLKPGGRFYAEEVLARVTNHPLVRRVFAHPRDDRFDREAFCRALAELGFVNVSSSELWGSFAWFVADRPTGALQ